MSSSRMESQSGDDSANADRMSYSETSSNEASSSHDDHGPTVTGTIKEPVKNKKEVTVANGRVGRGFNIFGGKKHTCKPFGATRSGIFINLFVRGGKALRIDDKILKINGEDMSKCTYQEAVMQLSKPENEIILTVQHKQLPADYQLMSSSRMESQEATCATENKEILPLITEEVTVSVEGVLYETDHLWMHLGATGSGIFISEVEMCLMGFTLGVTIKVVRPCAYGTDGFICSYPDHNEGNLPEIFLIAEEDVHYNVLVN